MKYIRDSSQTVRLFFGLGMGWVVAALSIILADFFIGTNWMNSLAPQFLTIGAVFFVISAILMLKNR
jgi:hypothetical protein